MKQETHPVSFAPIWGKKGKEEAVTMDYPTDGEYLAQTNDDIFDIAQAAVNLAMAVITPNSNMREQAIEVLGKYADWDNITLPVDVKRTLYIRNYGEDEVEAMVEAGEVSFKETNQS